MDEKSKNPQPARVPMAPVMDVRPPAARPPIAPIPAAPAPTLPASPAPVVGQATAPASSTPAPASAATPPTPKPAAPAVEHPISDAVTPADASSAPKPVPPHPQMEVRKAPDDPGASPQPTSKAPNTKGDAAAKTPKPITPAKPKTASNKPVGAIVFTLVVMAALMAVAIVAYMQSSK